MPFTCPNCDSTHEKVPGYVAQEEHTRRLNSKTEEIRALTSRVAELDALASDARAIRAERDRLAGELDSVREAGRIADAFASQGIADDPDLRDSFRAIYSSHIADLADDERPTFGDWLGSDAAREHVLLRPHYAAPPDDAGPAGDATENPPARTRIPNTDRHASDAPTTRPAPITPADLVSVFESSAYKGLPYSERTRLRAQWAQEIQAGTLTQVPTVG